MIIEAIHLRARARTYEGEESPALLELAPEGVIQAAGPVRYQFKAQLITGEIIVQGTLAVECACVCVRCMEPFERRVRVPEFFRAIPSSGENQLIDLTDDIREDMLLALPVNPVCSDMCKGLCVRCGVNLNRTPCVCGVQTTGSTWTALDQWQKIRDDSGGG